MSAGHVVVGRRGRGRSRAEVEALVAEYEASGVTRKAFCAGRGLSEATLDLYRKRAANATQPGRLLAVDVNPVPARIARMLPEAQACTLASCLTVVLGNGRRIEFASLDRDMLAELIGILERA